MQIKFCIVIKYFSRFELNYTNMSHDLGSGKTFAVLTMYVKHFANYVQSGIARIFYAFPA